MAQPKSVTELRSFLGLANTFQERIPGFSLCTQALTALLQTRESARAGQGSAFKLTPQAFEEFVSLKAVLASPPVLQHFQPGLPTFLYTDASLGQRGTDLEIPVSLGAVLTQIHHGQEVVCAFLSAGLEAAHRNYPIPRLESLAFVWAVGKLNSFLDGQTFTWRTDACANKFLREARFSNNQVLYRYSLVLQEYQFDTEWIPGLRMIADPLSRMMMVSAVESEAMTLPQLVFGENLGPRIAFLKDPIMDTVQSPTMLWLAESPNLCSPTFFETVPLFTLFATSQRSIFALDPQAKMDDVAEVNPVQPALDNAARFQQEDQIPVTSEDTFQYSQKEELAFEGLQLVRKILMGDPLIL